MMMHRFVWLLRRKSRGRSKLSSVVSSVAEVGVDKRLTVLV